MTRHPAKRCTAIGLVLLWLFATRGMASDREQPANALACRMANYRQFQEAAWSHLPTIGFRYVFINVPPPDQIQAVKQRLSQHGLSVAVIRGDADLSQPNCVDQLSTQLATCEELGVRYMFLSPKHPGVDKQVAYQRLRQAGDIAKKHRVTIALETHPDLGTNGDVHLETMRQINHPNIRVNFDAANMTYYNKHTDAVTELKKIMDYVATVELKDHNGQYESWNFPALGRGVVDLPGVLRVLQQHHYMGPITIEVEGIEGTPWDEQQIRQAIAESVAYVRSLGSFR